MEKKGDFGFSAIDEGDYLPPKEKTSATEEAILTQLQQIDSKLDELRTKSPDSKEVKSLKEKLKKVEECILPLLNQLLENEDKALINWPNRGPIIKQQIERILSYTRV
jgi:hypothetical protein